jgi:hypothetical protein
MFHAAGLSGLAPSDSKANLSAAIIPTSVRGKIVKATGAARISSGCAIRIKIQLTT